MGELMGHFHREIVEVGWLWFVFGLVAQFTFTARFLIQWIVSEKKGKSVIPVFFWYLSLAGGVMLLTYFLRRGEAVGALGQSTGLVVYVRNIMLIHQNKRKLDEKPA